MKKPEPIDFETDEEYEYAFQEYNEHLINEELNDMVYSRRWIVAIALLACIAYVGCLVLC